jgi:AAA domain
MSEIDDAGLVVGYHRDGWQPWEIAKVTGFSVERVQYLIASWDTKPKPQQRERTPKGDDEPVELFRRWSTKELLAADRTFRWSVRGMLVQPTYGPLAGEKKTLKTYLAAFVMLGLTSGRAIFDHFAVEEPVPVMAYVGEGGRIPHTRLLERVAVSMGVDLADVPLFTSYDVAPIASARFQETLVRDLREVGPRLVSLDPLYAYHGTTANASNLFEEGSLLTSLSAPCLEFGASLLVNTHFNKTGSGRGLDRITQAGAQEWADSWLLVSHRELPNVPAGHFRLLLEIGSRQWGGTEWDLDLELGVFDPDTGEYEGEISWELHRHVEGPVSQSLESRVLRLLADKPWQLTKTELVADIGGNAAHVRAVLDALMAADAVVCAKTPRIEGDRQVNRDLWATAGKPRPDGGPGWTGLVP